jgi:hypothetical protein
VTKQRIRGEVRGTKDSSELTDYRGGYGGLRRRFRPIDDVSERGKERERRGGVGEGVGGGFRGRFGLRIARGRRSCAVVMGGGGIWGRRN